MAEGSRGKDTWTLDGAGTVVNGNESGATGEQKPSIATAGFIDPEAARTASIGSAETSGNSTGGQTKKRGRPFGSKNKGAGKAEAHDPAAVARYYGFIIGLHTTLSIRVPELSIDDTEAQMLAKAIADVLAYYPTIKHYLEGKAAAHAALLIVCLQIYGTRLIAITARLKKERAEQANPNNVYQFGNPPVHPQFHA